MTREAPFRRITGDVRKGLLLLCDHAENRLPAEYGTLGLPPEQLARHIAYDIGIAPVAERVSAALGAPALMHRYCRLLIDPNRGLDDPTLIMRISDGAIVPGNALIDDEEFRARVEKYYIPYHEAIGAEIGASLSAGMPPVILSVHSFTEVWNGYPRPWHVTVLWDKDPRIALPLLDRLRLEEGVVVGDNEPYTGRLRGGALYRHGTRNGLAHALIEVRQDLIRDAAGQAAWAERLSRVIRDVMADPEVIRQTRRIAYHGSCTDAPADETAYVQRSLQAAEERV